MPTRTRSTTEDGDQHRDDDPATLEPAARRGGAAAGAGGGGGGPVRCLAFAAASPQVAGLVARVAGDGAQERLGRRGQRPEVVGVDPLHVRRGRWRGRAGPPAGGGRSAAGRCRRAPPSSCCRAWSTVVRAAGSLVRRPRSTGSRAPARTIGAGCSETTDIIVAMASPRANGGRPSTAAYSVAPSDHRSTGGRGSSPLTRSGPCRTASRSARRAWSGWSRRSVVAMPKSVRQAWPSSSTSTLAASRRGARCRPGVRRRARRGRRAPMRATARGSGPCSSRISCRLRAATCSITSQGLPSSSTTSYTRGHARVVQPGGGAGLAHRPLAQDRCAPRR